jgi:uncharacterized protein YcbK (DUF882 family)
MRSIVSVLVCFCGILLVGVSVLAQKPSLKGSSASVGRMDHQADLHDFTRLQTEEEMEKFVKAGLLVKLTGNTNYKVEGVSHPYVRPEVKLFIERLAAQSRTTCPDGLIVTSATRPKTEQPRNASKRSVHPAGMAIDLRVPDKSKCKNWLEKTLLDLEKKKVLEATREKKPPHYHIAVFPEPYEKYVDSKVAPAKKPVPAEKGKSTRK